MNSLLRPWQQAQTPDAGQRGLYLLETAHAEICRRDIDLLAGFVPQQCVQYVGEAIFDVVDDIGDAHSMFKDTVSRQASRSVVSYVSGYVCITAVAADGQLMQSYNHPWRYDD